MPCCSIIIPAYNAMNYLPQTLESVLKQTFTDFEVLIINDGSSDNIVEWFYNIVDSRVKLISQENQGVSAARNIGIKNSKADYIAFIDADDLWEPTKLEKQLQCFKDNPSVGLVHSAMTMIDQEGKSLGRTFISNVEGDALKPLLEQNTIVTSSVIVRRSCLDVGNFDNNLRSSEDWELWVRIALRYPIMLIKEPLVFYRQHPNNTTKNWQMLEQDLRSIEQVFQSVPQELSYLKNRTYGYANIYLAWKALQTGYSKQAAYFRNQAIKHYSPILFFPKMIRLNFAIALSQILGNNGFNRIQSSIYTIRRRFSTVKM
ncbi:glycosyltransferase family 2 protein [Plectonema cf. radiosum LEGE 06105]|uniref:Glycosyltransferase family 2 protein n=1 Tax=Plectonema cf. radiosum LEGE 06105 TaxID=945769 RepID=A0A8J7K1G3_9CYAN|nr:glycosyltransferase family 2 protein [Plectonema radiosum]MBE9214636.1 glycosyltransferase family 2 protein [Plectonema cf. radiosum LEGE 06105]